MSYVSPTRADALRLGHAFYTAKQPCKHRHPPLRYSANGKCVECCRVLGLEARKTTKPNKRPRAKLGDASKYPLSRAAAVAGSLRYYRAPKPCGRGHSPIRYASNGVCVECALGHSDRQNLTRPATERAYWEKELKSAQERAKTARDQLRDL